MPFFKVTTSYERRYWAEDEADALNMARYIIPTDGEVQIADTEPFFPVHDGFMIGDWICAYAVMVNRSHGRLLSEREDRPPVALAEFVDSIVTAIGKAAIDLEPAAITRDDMGFYAVGLDSLMGRHWIDLRYWTQAFECGLWIGASADDPSMFVLLDDGRPVGAVMGVTQKGDAKILWECEARPCES